MNDKERMLVMNQLVNEYENILDENTTLRDIFNLTKEIAKRNKIKITKQEAFDITILLQETEI